MKPMQGKTTERQLPVGDADNIQKDIYLCSKWARSLNTELERSI